MIKKIGIICLFCCLWIFFFNCNPIFALQVATQEGMACSYINKGEIDKAIEILQDMLKRNPDNLNAQLYLGIAFYMKEDSEGAHEKFEKIEKEIERMVGSSRPFGDEAMFTQMGMERKADLLFSEERKGLLYFCRGLTLKEKKDLKNAEKRFKKALKLKYDKMLICLQLLDLYIKDKDLKSASKELDEFKKEAGGNELFLFLDGYLKFRNNKIKDALAAFEKIAPANLEAAKNIARIHYNSGDYQKALEIWQGILSQNSEDKDAQICIGRAYFHLGDSAKAQEFFNQAGLKVTPDRYSPKKVPLVYETQLQRVKFDLKCK
jgi:pentatricopeptide repeat protein